MTKNDPIEVSIVANGFMVRPCGRQHEYITMESVHVFPSANDLSKFLFDHFGDHHAKPNDGGKRK